MKRLKCLIATGNPHKTESIKRLLGGLAIDLVDLNQLPPLEEPEEDGSTFLENALIKSRYYSKATGLIALADDSGLEVDAMDKAPGIYSSRFAGAHTTHEEKMAKILEHLQDLPAPQRTARFRCVAAATFPDGYECYAEGSMEGLIANSPAGLGGFGYDPIVFLPQLNKTVAQLTDDEKDSLSHRGEAFKLLIPKLFDRAQAL